MKNIGGAVMFRFPVILLASQTGNSVRKEERMVDFLIF